MTDTKILGGAERILLVDDDESVSTLLNTMLSRLGYDVDVFNSSLDALQILLSNRADYDLLITDLTMPHMTGIELSRKIRDSQRDIPIMILTGYGESEVSRDVAHELNIQKVIQKPILKNELADAVRDLLACT